MTLTDAHKQLVEQLTQRYGQGEAASIARIVMEDAFLWQKKDKLAHLDASSTLLFSTICSRLVQGEPVQYVLGEADFFGLKFNVSPAVLIPRQETEELVDWVLRHLKNQGTTQRTLLDIGTGSGCIGLTIKKKIPALAVICLDKSLEALDIAQANARRLLGENTLGLHFQAADILSPTVWEALPALDVIVSNPPYISLLEKHLVPQHVQAFEPAMALFVESEDPLLFYRVIATQALQKLNSGGALFFECNEFNALEVNEMLQQLGFRDVQLAQDLSGADRMAFAVRP